MIDISQVPLFLGIDRVIVENIFNASLKENFHAKEVIFRQGEASNGKAYVLLEGRIDVLINNQKVKELKAGDVFGEIALLNEEQRTATIIAQNDIQVLSLSYDDMMNMISNDQNIINREIINRIEENAKFTSLKLSES